MSRKSAVRRTAPAVLAVTAVILVATATGAGAAKLITSAQIKDNTIQSRDIRNGTIQSKDLAKGAVTKANLASSVQAGPVASGLITATSVSKAQGVPNVTVTMPESNRRCIHVPGVNSAQHVMVVTPDYSHDSTSVGTGYTSVAEVGSIETPMCNEGDFMVVTFIDKNGSLVASSQPFSFIVN